MALSSGRPPFGTAVVDEHRHLRRAADELAYAAIHTPPVAEGGSWCADLAFRLHDLSGLLEHHFRGEEAPDGLYAQLQRTVPEATAQIDGLQAQHQRLLDACRTLAEGAAATPLDSEAFYRLSAQVAGMLAELASHEANESDLMFRAAQKAAPGAVH